MSRTLEEAILHAEEAASDYEGMIEDYWLDSEKLAKCANEQRQIAEWLKELAERRKQIKSCKGCKWLRLPSTCVNDRCARMYKDRYEVEGRTDG